MTQTNTGIVETARSQLVRLAMLTDVVYAVGLVLVIQWLPLPEESTNRGIAWFAYIPIAALLRRRDASGQDDV